MRRFLPLLALALSLHASCLGRVAADESRRVVVTARAVPLDPDDPNRQRVGRLRYLGGIELRSEDRRLGGISGLRWREERLMAITDMGDWIEIEPSETGQRLIGVNRVHMARMRGIDGTPIAGKENGDAEAVEILADGSRLVAFERRHRLWRYPHAHGAAEATPGIEKLEGLAPNNGVEAMGRAGAHMVYLAEAADADGWGKGVIDGPDGVVSFRFELPEAYLPTDLDAVDDRHVLVLLRSYSVLTGVGAKVELREVDSTGGFTKLADVATLRPPLAVDNMEALAIRREEGRTFVYLASDNNFSPLQRTLLLKFELMDRP